MTGTYWAEKKDGNKGPWLLLVRYGVHVALMATVLNLKRMVRVLFGVGFRETACA